LLCDGGGLWLQTGLGKGKQVTKSWIFRYAAAGTKVSRIGREYRRERQMRLGPVHTVGLAEAREMARQARLLVQQGKDPIDERDAARGAAAAAEAYLQKFEDSWKSPVHRQGDFASIREEHVRRVWNELKDKPSVTDRTVDKIGMLWPFAKERLEMELWPNPRARLPPSTKSASTTRPDRTSLLCAAFGAGSDRRRTTFEPKNRLKSQRCNRAVTAGVTPG
jgi:hypothetical protein